MPKHNDEDFARASREIAGPDGDISRVTNYQIAMHLKRSPGGGLYHQLETWRASVAPEDQSSSPGASERAALRLDSLYDILGLVNHMARDIAGVRIDALRQLLRERATERDEAKRKVENLHHLLLEARAQTTALRRELYRVKHLRQKAQISLAAAQFSAILASHRPRRRMSADEA